MDISGFTATELDELISKAAEKRAGMIPYVANDPPTDGLYTINPGWFINIADGGTLMQVRDPGVGWISFVIPPYDRARITSLLLLHSLLPATSASDSNPALPTQSASGGNNSLH